VAYNALGLAEYEAIEAFKRYSPRNSCSMLNYNRFLLLVAGLGGLLYGVDVAIIAGALPYLEATSDLTAGKLSFVVAAVLLGSVISTLFAGLLADWMGRKRLMILSGFCFVASIPMIALAHGYTPLVLGRLLQGISAGLIGVVVPLYLAECLSAAHRGRGTGIFQWLADARHRGRRGDWNVFQHPGRRCGETRRSGRVLAFKDRAWRSIFWVVAAAGSPVRLRQFFGDGISPVAFLVAPEGRGPGGAASLTFRRTGRS